MGDYLKLKHDDTFDVVVIGGGVTGAAIAWQFAKADIRTALIEKEGICSGASATNPGFCVLSYRPDQLQLEMARKQMKDFKALEKELEVDLEFSVTGSLIPISNQKELEVLSGLVNRCHRMGFHEIEMVTPERAARQEPALDPDKIISAVYCPGEGLINPFNLTNGFASTAGKYGAEILTQTSVTSFETTGSKISAIITTAGKIKTEFVILAAGAWTKEIASMADIDIPVKYERGEAMVSMAVPRMIRGMVTDGSLFAVPKNKPEMVVGACLGQTASGNIVMAQATTDGADYSCRTTYEGPVKVARKVLGYFPRLKDLEIIRMWAGVVGYTDDNKPVFGYTGKPDNLLIVTNFHSAVGVSAGIAEMTLEAYKQGRTTPEVLPYSPERYYKTE